MPMWLQKERIIIGLYIFFIILLIIIIPDVNSIKLTPSCNSNSMYPIIQCGQKIIISEISTGNLSWGDIIVYSTGNYPQIKKDTGYDWIVHRIIGYDCKPTWPTGSCSRELAIGYITKGDNNPYNDLEYWGVIIKKEDIMGVVKEIY